MKASAAKKSAAKKKALSGGRRKAPLATASEELVTGIARVLGEAHGPIGVDDIMTQLFVAGHRPEAGKLFDVLDGMVPEFASRHPGSRYWTPVADASSADLEEEAAAAVQGQLPAPQEPTLAALLASAKRKNKRITESLTLDQRHALEFNRNVMLKTLDVAKADIAATTRTINVISRVLRRDKLVRTVETATVPDRGRRLLITYDVSGLSEGREPIELSSKPLPRRFGVAAVEQTPLVFVGVS